MRLSDAAVQQFREQGVLIAEGVLTDADLAPVIEGYSRWLTERAKALQAEGKITNLAEGEPFDRRFGILREQSREIERGMDIMNARLPEMFAFLLNDNLLDVVGSLLGTDEITCNPIQHIRGKTRTPENSGGFLNVPWHQDIGVTWEEADDSDIITCWIPLVDATLENGAMQILPGVWRSGFLPHCRDEHGDTAIRPDALPYDVEPLSATVKKGGIVFMDRRTPHRGTPNHTDIVRWSIDLRYQPNGQPTGRPFHPAFVARSPSHPETVCTDHAEWSRLWEEALAAPPPAKSAHRVM